MTSVALVSVVEAAVLAVRPAAAAKGIRLTVTLGEVPPVAGDPDRLQQVVWNLLSNAIKFTPDAGRVEVQLARIGRRVAVTVSDSGCGIAADALPSVFAPFDRADATASRGLGLGLSLVRHLVERHGGTIEVMSAGAGLGSTFVMTLPAAAAEAAPATAVGSTREALEAVSRNAPDVVVSDIRLPGDDGYVFIRKLRALSPERGGRTPAVALTGFQMHVPKPVQPTDLAAVVAALARRTEAA